MTRRSNKPPAKSAKSAEPAKPVESIKTVKTAQAFKQLCQDTADELGITVNFYRDLRRADVHQDDGALHVIRRRLRAVFDVSNGQMALPPAQNYMTGLVLDCLGIDATKGDIVERVFVDEAVDGGDDDGDYCPNCGASLR